MKTIITNGQSLGERMNWEHGDHSGTITFPGEERGPVDIQWDGDCPDDWEEIEALVEAAASESFPEMNDSSSTMNAAPSSYSLANDPHAAVIGSSGWLSHTCPQDAYRLSEAGQCACGQAALAAALGRNAGDILHAFPGPGLWVNDKRMIAALNTLKVGWKQHGQEIEDTGTTAMSVVWLQGIGSWMRPGVPIGARNQRTHWIATCGDAIYDLNADSWLPAEVWRGQVLPDIIAQWKAQPIPAVRETFSVWDNDEMRDRSGSGTSQAE